MKSLREDISEKLFNANGKMNPWTLKEKWIEKNNLVDLYKMIDDSIQENLSLKDKIFTHYLHEGEVQRCKTCGSNTRYHASLRKFATFCSSRCASQDEEIKKSKAEKTDFAEISRKGKETKLLKYGCENYNNPEKRVETCLERYGVENASQTTESRKKISDKLTGLEKDFKNGFPNQKHISKEVLDCLDDIEWLSEENKSKPQCQIAKELGVSHSLVNSRCVQYRIEPKFRNRSTQEIEIFDWVSSLGFNAIPNHRKFGLEIDIFIPEKKIGIELNGVYFHSAGTKDELKKLKNKHLEKTTMCENNGVQLIHFLDTEWISKKDICKSMIRSKLGECGRKIYARKCSVGAVSTKETRQFLEENHIQGFCGSSEKLGLYHEGELVSIMTVGAGRYSKKKLELLRFCNLLNTSVVGAFSKLLSRFEFDEIVSYGNRRWCGLDNVYRKNGFEFSHCSSPNYFYVDKKGNINSRLKYQKHKLKGVLEKFSENLSEQENMLENKFRIIHDCGNFVYFMKRQFISDINS